MNGLHDAHCHLDFSPDAEQACGDAAGKGCFLFVNTVVPSAYGAAVDRLAGFGNVAVGLGLHPWWLPEVRDDEVAEASELASGARFVGEVGLDFGRKGQDPERQVRAFEAIMGPCGEVGGKVISIHAVRSAGEVLDILVSTGALETCTCIFHWFSGTSEQLARARDAGCLFSVNPMMARSRRGREYIRQLPARSLLLESDAPGGPGDACPFQALHAALAEALDAIASIKGEAAREVVLDTGRRLFA